MAGIKIACKGADVLPLDAIEDFQGNLKRRSKKDIDLIVRSIDKYGFSFPFFVWNGDGHNRCLDGHGRIQALAEMRRRGVSLPLFPVAYIEAADEAEAKQKLLRLNSQYGQMSIDSVLEFTSGLEVDFGDLALPAETLEISGVDAMADFPDMPDGDREPFQQMTFTLADEQAEVVKEAIKKAQAEGLGQSEVNANSNGNALFAVCEAYCGA